MSTVSIGFAQDFELDDTMVVDRDHGAYVRMQRLNEALKVVHEMNLPLCGDCISFHAKSITCSDAERMAYADELIYWM